MLKALWIGASAMDAQGRKVDNIANNLANSQTNGYKKSREVFEDLIYQKLNVNSLPVKNKESLPLQEGTGVKLAAQTVDFTEGKLITTGRDLDIALEGDGLIQIMLPSGEKAYTRDGSLNINGQGKIVTKQGYELIPGLNIQANQKITFRSDGTILGINEKGESQELGKIKIFKFANPQSLVKVDGNMFLANAQSGQPQTASDTTVRQGFLETSNVDLAEEMTQMIMAQRSYELNSRVIKQADEMWALANNIRS